MALTAAENTSNLSETLEIKLCATAGIVYRSSGPGLGGNTWSS